MKPENKQHGHLTRLPNGTTVRRNSDGVFGTIERFGLTLGTGDKAYNAYYVRWFDGHLGLPNESDFLPCCFNYKPYPAPKRAMYYATGNEYVKNPHTGLLGWSEIECETTVIGEDDTSYVEELKPHRNSDTWEPDYGKMCLLPLGFHKSRLIKWLPMPGEQLELFDLKKTNHE